jgi:cell division protein FtsZ
MRFASDGINELKKNCDTVIVIPNERLLDICDEDTTMMAAFEIANEVLYNATRGISDLILLPGLINLDFADVRTTMQDGGAAIMGSASASGPDRAEIAAREAINSPLLDGISIRGARNVLVNISANASLGMKEVNKATSIISNEAGDDAEIIMGTVMDESMGDELRMTVIATGFELADTQSKIKISVNTDVRATQRIKAPAETQTALRTATDNLTGKTSVPRSEDLTARFAGTAHNSDPWRGEKNLKNLDTPAIERRKTTLHDIQDKNNENEEQESNRSLEAPRRFGTGNILLNNREERINKGDSEQPAFLRRAMD